MSLEQKYLKYKTKYLDLKNQFTINALSDITAFAREKRMSLEEFHEFLMKPDKNRNPKYDYKEIHNPMIIGKYVVRAVGHRADLYLEARPILETDTPEALIAMANVTDNVYIDMENTSKYVVINRLSDY